MAVILNTHDFVINGTLTMRYDSVPFAVASHLMNVSTTPSVEADGDIYVRTHFPIAHSLSFSEAVCEWGGPRTFGRIWSRVGTNHGHVISRYLSAAFHAPNLPGSLSNVRLIHGLGVSYGTKHLRMMDPSRFVVLDQIISNNLGYSLDIRGYAEICRDCTDIAQRLTSLALTNPMATIAPPMRGVSRGSSTNWWPADVETALFAECQKWSLRGAWLNAQPIHQLPAIPNHPPRQPNNGGGHGPFQINPTNQGSYERIQIEDGPNLGYICLRRGSAWITVYDLLQPHLNVDVRNMEGFHANYMPCGGPRRRLLGSFPLEDLSVARNWIRTHWVP